MVYILLSLLCRYVPLCMQYSTCVRTYMSVAECACVPVCVCACLRACVRVCVNVSV